MNEVTIPELHTLGWGDWMTTKYNRARLSLIPRAATPLIILGIALTILGTIGLITALSGSQITHLEFIAEHIPASVALSLLMMRAGIHSINNGVMQARKLSRWRQEGMNAWMQAQITKDPAVCAKLLIEAASCHWSLPPEFGLNKKLSKNFLYGKMKDDLHLPGDLLPSNGCFSTVTQGWYDFWLDKQSMLGKLDVAVGQVMLIAGIASLIFLCAGKGHLPPVLEKIADNSYLSLSFSFLLFAYWLDCSKRGMRMQGVKKREGKRADIERQLQLIVIGNTHRKHEISEEQIPNNHRMEHHKKSALSSLAKPMLIVGALITLLGLLYLCQCLTNSLPTKLDFLTDNVPLSTLFATTLITMGFYAFYQGVSMLDKRHKVEVRRCTRQRADAVVGKIYNRAIHNDLLNATPLSESLGARSLKWISVPGYVLGTFLVLSGVIGIFAAGGLPVSDYLSFITKDPSFSAFFCVTTLLFGADAISNADRMRSYQNRKIFDQAFLNLLMKENGEELQAHR